MSLFLSKSKYCNAVQCPKMLWLKVYKPEEFNDAVMNQTVLQNGNDVGDLAMGLFGPFTEVTTFTDGRLDIAKMIEKTTEEVAKGTLVICEASFSYEGKYCAVDLLKNLGNNEVEIYEVKSSTDIHEIYNHDVAYQNYVLTNLGYTVKGVYLVHLNRNYVRHGDLDLSQLFTINDVTAVAKERYEDVEQRLAALETYMTSTEEPEKKLSPDCFKPYDCGFFDYCSRNLPKPNVFDLASFQKRSAFKLFNQGIISFEDIYKNNAVSGKQMTQIEHALFEKGTYINKTAIQEFMEKLSYPLYFLDFESCMFPIPEYEDSKPYQQIPFQYSLHYIEEENGEVKHKEFLAYPGKDPRRDLAEALCNDIPMNACVMAYNMGFEKGRIGEMAELFPDLSDHLRNISEHMKDLMVPFQTKNYYCRAMEGSYSIKYVLPALFPNDPSLDYHNLEGVHKGDEASSTFIQMQSMSKEELETWRGYLLKYCGLDTFAMVKIWQKLKEIIEE